jgi:hypothetical protein
MEPRDSPYVFRDEPSEPESPDPEGRDVVIVDGRAMSYRRYRRGVDDSVEASVDAGLEDAGLEDTGPLRAGAE